MGVSKRPRKPYKQREVLRVMQWVTEGVTPLCIHRQGEGYIKMLLRTYAALDELNAGRGGQEHCTMLHGMLEVAEVLHHEQGMHAEDAVNILAAGRVAIRALINRGATTDQFAMTSLELAAITALMIVHEAQLAHCNVDILGKTLLFLQKQKGVMPDWLKVA